MGKELYVGNLSYNVTNEALEQLFAEFGAVRSAEVIHDRDTGRSKGFGFVEMEDENAAREAINGLHEKEHDGRPLTVNEARPRRKIVVAVAVVVVAAAVDEVVTAVVAAAAVVVAAVAAVVASRRNRIRTPN